MKPLFITSVLHNLSRKNMKVVKININAIACVVVEDFETSHIYLIGGTALVVAQTVSEIIEKIENVIGENT